MQVFVIKNIIVQKAWNSKSLDLSRAATAEAQIRLLSAGNLVYPLLQSLTIAIVFELSYNTNDHF